MLRHSLDACRVMQQPGFQEPFDHKLCVKARYYQDTCVGEVIFYVSCSRMVQGDAWAAADQPNERVNGGG